MQTPVEPSAAIVPPAGGRPPARVAARRVRRVAGRAAVCLLLFAVTLPYDAAISEWAQRTIPPGTALHRIFKLARWPFIWQIYIAIGVGLQIYEVRRRRDLPGGIEQTLNGRLADDRSGAAADRRGAKDWRTWLTPTPRVIGLMVACAACFGLVHLTKSLIGRARPDQALGAYRFEPFGNLSHGFDSLPSAHTAAAVLLTALVIRYWPRLGIWLIPLATLASLSRVIQGRHWLSDVIAGAGLTLLVLTACMVWLGPQFYLPLRARSGQPAASN